MPNQTSMSCAPGATADPILGLVEEWLSLDAALNKLPNEEYYASPEHPNLLQCCAIEEQIANMRPASHAVRILRRPFVGGAEWR